MKRRTSPHRFPGSDDRPEVPGMDAALRGLDGEKRQPTEADTPPVSTFPMTAGARWAVRVWHRRGRLGVEDDQLVLLPPEEKGS